MNKKQIHRQSYRHKNKFLHVSRGNLQVTRYKTFVPQIHSKIHCPTHSSTISPRLSLLNFGGRACLPEEASGELSTRVKQASGIPNHDYSTDKERQLVSLVEYAPSNFRIICCQRCQASTLFTSRVNDFSRAPRTNNNMPKSECLDFIHGAHPPTFMRLSRGVRKPFPALYKRSGLNSRCSERKYLLIAD